MAGSSSLCAVCLVTVARLDRTFEEHLGNANGPTLYKTRPLTYYVDLNELRGTTPNSIDSNLVSAAETYFHQTLIAKSGWCV